MRQGVRKCKPVPHKYLFGAIIRPTLLCRKHTVMIIEGALRLTHKFSSMIRPSFNFFSEGVSGELIMFTIVSGFSKNAGVASASSSNG